MLGVASALSFAILMGAASIFSRRGMETGSFYALLVTSLAIGAPVFLAVTFATTGFAATPWLGLVYAGASAVVGSVLGRSLYFIGIQYLGPGKSLSINSTSPLYAALLAWVVLGERLTVLVVGGTLAIVAGIVVLSKDVRRQTDQADHSAWVALFPLVAAVFAAAAVILRKLALTAGIEPIEAAAVNFVVALVVVTPPLVTPWRERLLTADRSAIRNYIFASCLMTGAFLFYFVGLEITDASIFFPLIQTQPLMAVLLSAIFLRELEVITRWTALGSAIIVSGAALVVIG
ncbi:MAG: DMT family transporter [Salinirussus sp.]